MPRHTISSPTRWSTYAAPARATPGRPPVTMPHPGPAPSSDCRGRSARRRRSSRSAGGLVAAAVCPHPPLLVPELAGGAASELDDVRARCAAAVDVVWRDSDVVYVVGPASEPVSTSLAPWGVDIRVDVPEPLPLAHLVGA